MIAAITADIVQMRECELRGTLRGAVREPSDEARDALFNAWKKLANAFVRPMGVRQALAEE